MRQERDITLLEKTARWVLKFIVLTACLLGLSIAFTYLLSPLGRGIVLIVLGGGLFLFYMFGEIRTRRFIQKSEATRTLVQQETIFIPFLIGIMMAAVGFLMVLA